jgi:hypothetical protein
MRDGFRKNRWPRTPRHRSGGATKIRAHELGCTAAGRNQTARFEFQSPPAAADKRARRLRHLNSEEDEPKSSLTSGLCSRQTLGAQLTIFCFQRSGRRDALYHRAGSSLHPPKIVQDARRLSVALKRVLRWGHAQRCCPVAVQELCSG